jgi:hypothetical protein
MSDEEVRPHSKKKGFPLIFFLSFVSKPFLIFNFFHALTDSQMSTRQATSSQKVVTQK